MGNKLTRLFIIKIAEIIKHYLIYKPVNLIAAGRPLPHIKAAPQPLGHRDEDCPTSVGAAFCGSSFLWEQLSVGVASCGSGFPAAINPVIRVKLRLYRCGRAE